MTYNDRGRRDGDNTKRAAMWVVALLVLIAVNVGLIYASTRNNGTTAGNTTSSSQSAGSGTTSPRPTPFSPSNR
jgi:hypothetical protein